MTWFVDVGDGDGDADDHDGEDDDGDDGDEEEEGEGEADVDNVEDARDVEGYEEDFVEDFVEDCKEGFVGDYADDEVKVGGVKAEVGSSSLRTSPSQELSGTNINACTIPSNPLFVA